MLVPLLDDATLIEKLSSQDFSFFHNYYAFYSSWYGGIVKNPRFMLLPIDDHMVHRGDGVFEAMKAVNRSVYLMNEHLQRLAISAERIGLQLPFTLDEIKTIILATLSTANQPEAMVRVFLSRGPGNFSVNPYDPIKAQLYVIVTHLSTPSEEKYAAGANLGKSSVPCKPASMAQIKSCNYLPNVLMKKEAVDKGFDFMIGIDEKGFITESATENIMLVNQQGVLIHPPLDNILKGTTMIRTCELARENGIAVEVKPITLTDLLSAQEVFLAGTSLNILAAVSFERRPIGTGKPGAIANKLNMLILTDMEQGSRSVYF